MSVAAKVAQEKREHPDRFCPVPSCLWRVKVFARVGSEERVLAPRCEDGYCPRHQHLKPRKLEVTL